MAIGTESTDGPRYETLCGSVRIKNIILSHQDGPLVLSAVVDSESSSKAIEATINQQTSDALQIGLQSSASKETTIVLKGFLFRDKLCLQLTLSQLEKSPLSWKRDSIEDETWLRASW